ncbi:SusC/RagA family TonB-linked outer membrane protein [Mucilaginibacter auburnensis]|uniref:TonB-linked SusC/RagA family outer membrane protein n=1 Tax=Mucilaginibacter auburnensis TaxID=1457233 RepID=A0A2H9VU34_9SPHI|nr:SusC/RagA family TonB-linked outer membrane protein [Mucilaginibacter auburnensis]PJJ84309.1 TonB-linked SusC/RagA family outer membrane protein [Mucilaginibacter auburnensis]
MSKLQLFKNVRLWKTLCLIAMISFVSTVAFAQNITVKGRVLDDKGEPLVGATIKATGTNNAVTADASGNFSLSVPSNTPSVTITFLGYVDVVKAVAGNPNLGNITMAANSRDLNEVVVVGYGTVKRTEVTGTVATVSAKVLQEIPAANVVTQLQGRVAGLDIVNGQMTIRGYRTIGNQGADRPLIVVDGVPYYNDISNINPNDIKSVDVLKGASSTAIYGSRGSGGVILITTNRGRVGRTETSYDSFIGISKLQGSLKTLDATGYAQLKADAYEGALLQKNNNAQAYPLTASELANQAAGVNTDWVKLLIKQQLVWDQNLRVSSGTEKTQFNAALGYRRTTNGNLQPNNTGQRVTMNINVDHQLTKVIKFGAQTRNTLNTNDASGGDQLGTAQWMSPLATPYNADGSINLRPLTGQLDESTANPLLRGTIPDMYYNYTRGWVSDNIVYAELKPIDHLTYKYTVNYNYSQSTGNVYNGINGVNIVNVGQTTASTNNSTSFRVAQEHLLNYNNTFGKHSINLTGVFTAERQHNEGSSMSAQNIPQFTNKNANLNLGTFTGFNGNWTETGLLSYVGRLNYTFNNRYNFTASMRADGNSTLAQGNQWTSYPAFGLGWTLTNEDFMKKYTFVDNLKLRAGYGENSTISGGAYNTLGPLDLAPFQFGGVTAGNKQGVRVTNLTNPTLTWQRTHEANVALDFAVLKNRITGTVEAFYQKTTGIILNNILPSTIGVSSMPTNLGVTENKGIEVTLSTVNIQDLGGFSWSSDFNIGFIREKIVSLPNGAQRNIGSGLFVGQPLSVIYDVRKLGIWQVSDSPGPTSTVNGVPVYAPVRGQTSPLQYPGQIRVQDVDGNGKIDADDNQIIGHFNPNYTFGFTNRFAYKGFDASLVITARMGFTTLVPYVSSNNSGTEGWQFLNLGRHNQPVIDYWTPRNPTNAFPMPNNQFFSQYYSTLQYYDGSFIRAKAVNLGYNIPANAVKRIGLSSLRVYANITNPFVIYSPVSNFSFSVTDPESVPVTPVPSSTSGNIGGGNRAVGLNAGTQRREFYFGIQARF